jgi:hypothetical protein
MTLIGAPGKDGHRTKPRSGLLFVASDYEQIGLLQQTITGVHRHLG